MRLNGRGFSLFFQNVDFLRTLSEKLGSSTPGSIQITRLIIDTVSRIGDVQCLSISKQSRKNILDRGVEKSVILKRDMNIQGIVTGLLSNSFHDKEGIMKFQHFMYRNVMSLEIKCIVKER